MNCEDQRTSPIDWAVQEGHAEAVLAALARRQARRRKRRRIAGAGALLGVLLLATVVIPVVQEERESSAGRGGAMLMMRSPERLVFEDGSVVQLRSDAAVEATFTSSLRKLRLLRGEIHVEVAKEQNRPFVVAAGMFSVRAVGTAFSVSQTSGGLDVLVTEGVVAVDHDESTPAPDERAAQDEALAVLKAGDHALIESAHSGPSDAPLATVRNLPPEEMSERLAWRIPRIEISDTPLVEILPVLTEHAGVDIVLKDPEIGAYRLSGIIRADNIEALFQLLDQSFGVQATAVGAQTFELQRR